MKLITVEESQLMVEGFKDGMGKPVDAGIAQALAEFVRVAKALGFETMQSCEGHIDWGAPYPWIDFQVPHMKIPLPPRWKVWRIRQRIMRQRENEKHARNEEKKCGQLCVMLTRYLVRYELLHGSTHTTALHIERWQRSEFRLMPVHVLLSEGFKTASDNKALDKTLETQRNAISMFASFCVTQLEKETNLVGIPQEGCPGCMGRG